MSDRTPLPPNAVSLVEAANPVAVARTQRERGSCLQPPLGSSVRSYEEAFRPVHDRLRAGELLAWVLVGVSGDEPVEPRFWRFITFWEVDWDRGVLWPGDPVRRRYGVMVAPAPVVEEVKATQIVAETTTIAGEKRCEALAHRLDGRK